MGYAISIVQYWNAPTTEEVRMPAKKRNWKREYELQKKRGEHEGRMERQRGRRAYDKKRTGSVNKKASSREGMDLAHAKPIHKGGKNKDGVRLETPSKNRSNNYKKKGKA